MSRVFLNRRRNKKFRMAPHTYVYYSFAISPSPPAGGCGGGESAPVLRPRWDIHTGIYYQHYIYI